MEQLKSKIIKFIKKYTQKGVYINAKYENKIQEEVCKVTNKKQKRFL